MAEQNRLAGPGQRAGGGGGDRRDDRGQHQQRSGGGGGQQKQTEEEKAKDRELYRKLLDHSRTPKFRTHVTGRLPPEHRNEDTVTHLIDSLLRACRDNKKLLSHCEWYTLLRAAEEAARRGLWFGDNVAWAIPYQGQVQFQLGYRGAIMMVERSNKILMIDCQPVFEQDHCKLDFGTGLVEHTFPWTDRGECVGVYSWALLKGAPQKLLEGMTRNIIEKIRQSGPGRNSPAWQNWWEEMGRAKCVKRMCKRLPLEREIDLSDDEDNTIDGVAVDVEEELNSLMLTPPGEKPMEDLGRGKPRQDERQREPARTEPEREPERQQSREPERQEERRQERREPERQPEQDQQNDDDAGYDSDEWPSD